MVSARFEFVGPVSTQVSLTIDGTGDAELPCPEAGADDFDCFHKKTGVKCQVVKSGWDLEAAVAAKSSGMAWIAGQWWVSWIFSADLEAVLADLLRIHSLGV